MSNSSTSDRERHGRTLLEVADELRALARTGLHYATDHYNQERYERILALAVRLASLATDSDPSRLEVLFRDRDDGYVTPKLDVRLAAFEREGDDVRVLMVRERADGLWALPGGYVDVGNSPAEAAVRETWEEAGLRVRAVRLAGVFDPRLRPEAPPHLFHIHKLVFAGELVDPGAAPSPGPEVIEAAFHPVDALPELSRGRTLDVHVREALRVADDPHGPAYFD
jgi:8-oxo-dGTP pyrophosphatase MutT (NUDIX family)